MAHAPAGLLNFATALLLLVLAGFLLAARRRERANLYLASFLGLVAANFLAGLATTALRSGPDLAGWFPSTTAGQISRAIEMIFFALDPLALLLFASVHAGRSPAVRVALVGAPVASAVFVTVIVVAPQSILPSLVLPWRAAFFAYVFLAYVTAYLGVAKGVLGLRGDIRRQRGDLLVVGLGFAVFSRIGQAWNDFGHIERFSLPLGTPLDDIAAPLVLRVTTSLAALFVCWGILRWRTDAASRASLRSTMRSTIALLGLMVPAWSAHGLDVLVVRGLDLPVLGGSLGVLNQSGYAIRWLVFGGLATYALTRDRILLGDGARRRHFLAAGLATGTVAVSLLFGGLASSFTAREPPAGTVLLASLVVAVVLLVAGEAWRLSHKLTDTGADSTARARAAEKVFEAYRAAVEEEVATHGADAVRSPALLEVRRRLGISTEEHQVAVYLATVPPESRRLLRPLAEGSLLAARYHVESRIATGATGRVFLARDTVLDRSAVIKEVWNSSDARGLARPGLAEARLSARLEHPSIARTLDVVEGREAVAIVMEHVPGGTLAQLLDGGRPLPEDAARLLARGLLGALGCAHQAGIVHRDVKPANILAASAQGPFKLADFGVAAFLDLSPSSTRVSLAQASRAAPGTPRYAAPELLRGAPATVATDLYAAALVLAEAVSAREPDGPADAIALVPGEWRPALARALLADPGARPASASELLALLEAAWAARGAPGSGGPAPPSA